VKKKKLKHKVVKAKENLAQLEIVVEFTP